MDNKENEPCEIISLDAVTEFLVKNNGKVKQADLINHFRCQLSSPATKGKPKVAFFINFQYLLSEAVVHRCFTE